MAQPANFVGIGVRVPTEARDAQEPAVAEGAEQTLASTIESVRARRPLLGKSAHEFKALLLCLDDQRPDSIERGQWRDPNGIHQV